METILSLVLAILSAVTPDAYLQAQDQAATVALRDPSLFVEVVKEHSKPQVRVEALAVLELTERDDVESVLVSTAKDDADPVVREQAQILYYRYLLESRPRDLEHGLKWVGCSDGRG